MSAKIKTSFIKVKCGDCGNEQITFHRISSKVDCHVCGSNLAEPTGGFSSLNGEVVEEVE